MSDGWNLAISRACEEQPSASLPGSSGAMGRPRGRFAEIDWALGEELYVEGEMINPVDGGAPERVWPTLEQIGKRLGCTMQAVFNHSKRNKWASKKRKFQYEHEFGELQARSEGNPIPASRLTRKPLAIVEDYIAMFEDAVRNKKLRADAVGDFDKAVRLRAFLLNEGASEATKRQLMSLEEMRDRHDASRKRRTTYDERAAGVVTNEEQTEQANAPRARPDAHALEAQETQTPEPEAKPPKQRKVLTAEELSARARRGAATAAKNKAKRDAKRRRKAGFKR